MRDAFAVERVEIAVDVTLTTSLYAKCVHLVESSRNLYTREAEHMDRFRNGHQHSFIRNHQSRMHQEVAPD